MKIEGKLLNIEKTKSNDIYRSIIKKISECEFSSGGGKSKYFIILSGNINFNGTPALYDKLRRRGVKCIIADSYSHFSYRVLINSGIWPLKRKTGIDLKDEDIVELVPETGVINSRTCENSSNIFPVNGKLASILRAGGLLYLN